MYKRQLVAKVETDRIPLVRQWMRLLDCVFIDRANARKSMEAMNLSLIHI